MGTKAFVVATSILKLDPIFPSRVIASVLIVSYNNLGCLVQAIGYRPSFIYCSEFPPWREN